VTCLVSMQNWDIFSFQELYTDPCDMEPLSYWNMTWWRRMNGMIMGLKISSQYLCAFKLPSIKCNCGRCP
jgi:hypothetical protein